MIVYLIMLIVSILFVFFMQKANNKIIKIICGILSIAPLFLVSAFRYDLGTDYSKRYVHDYERIAQGFPVNNLEVLFLHLINVCLKISQKPDILFILTSFIIIVLIMEVIFLKSENKILSIVIFVLGGFYFESLNLVRQYISVSLILFGSIFLLKNNWKYSLIYVLFVILATAFHTSAIVAIILVFFTRKNYSSWLWVLPISFGIIIFHDSINNLINEIVKFTRYNKYSIIPGEISYLNIFKNLLIYIGMQQVYIQNKKKSNIQNLDKLFLNIQAITVLVVCLGACNFQFSRVAIYFCVFQIISIPYFVNKFSQEPFEKLLRKILKKENIKLDLKPLVNICVVCFLGVILIYTNVLGNDNEVRPYKTVFDKSKYIDYYKIEQIKEK